MKESLLAVAVVLAASGCYGNQATQALASPTAHASSPNAEASPSPIGLLSASPPATSSPIPTLATGLTIGQLLATCPSSAALASVDSSLSMTFTSDPSAGSFVCTTAQGSRDLTLLQERAYQAVLIFTWIHFDKPVPWTDKPLDIWFAHAIHGVDFRSDTQNAYCCNTGGVIVIPTTVAVLSPTNDPIQDWIAFVALAAVFVHEARHNEGYVHTCGAWDNTLAELGAWGAQYYFLLWVGNHSRPSIVPGPYREAAAQRAADLVGTNGVFCNPGQPTP